MASTLAILAPPPEASLRKLLSAPAKPDGQDDVGDQRHGRRRLGLHAPRKSHGTAGGSALADPDDELVLEGLGRLVAGLPPAAMAGAGLQLTQPFVMRAQAFAIAGASS
jgi:hypothetical protein